jgi:hypothetical protein
MMTYLMRSVLVAAAVVGSSYLSATIPQELSASAMICPNASAYGQPSPSTGGIGNVAGEVYSLDGQPLADVQVFIQDRETGFQTGVLSRQDGSFRISGVPYGLHVVRFQKVGYAFQDHQAMVFGDGTHAICAVLSVLPMAMEY